MKAVAYSAIAAIVSQPLLFFAWFFAPGLLAGASVTVRDMSNMTTLVTLFSAAFVVLLGVPSFLLLRYLNRASWLSLACVGFLLPAIPLAILNWPLNLYGGSSYSASWHGRSVDFAVNGVPTAYGWLQFAESTVMFGLHGLVGALVFFLVWRKSSPN